MQNDVNKHKQESLQIILSKIKEEELGSEIYFPRQHLAKTAKSYMSIHSDISSVLNALEELIQLKSKMPDDETIVKKALWTFIIITYGRCFTDASKSKQSKLEANDCFNKSQSHLRIMHDEIMRIRHDFVAHRGDTEFEQSLLYLKMIKPDDKTEYKIKSLTAYTGGLEKLINYKELINIVKKIAFDKMKRNLEKLHSSLSNGTPKENAAKLIPIKF